MNTTPRTARRTAAAPRTLLALAAAAALGLSSAPALASTVASSSLTGLSWALFDLDPLDGTAASITFTMPAEYFDNFARAEVSNSISQWVYDPKSGAANLLASAALPLYGSSATASVNTPQELTPLNLALSSQGSVNNLVPSVTGWFNASSSSQHWSFELSANTLVMFQAQVAVSVTTVGEGYQDAYASATLRVTDQWYGSESASTFTTLSGQSSGYQNLERNKTVSIYDYAGGSNSFNGTVALTFTNETNASMTGFVGGNTYVSGYSGVTPVPEPHTWAMLFAGLGLLGGVAMRRRVGR